MVTFGVTPGYAPMKNGKKMFEMVQETEKNIKVRLKRGGAYFRTPIDPPSPAPASGFLSCQSFRVICVLNEVRYYA